MLVCGTIYVMFLLYENNVLVVSGGKLMMLASQIMLIVDFANQYIEEKIKDAAIRGHSILVI